MKAFIDGAVLALLVAGCGDQSGGNGAAGGNASVPLAQIAAPNGDWAQTVARTPDGGYLMGNPAAKVRLVEFGSMTCSHCADFAEHGMPALTDKYVKSGQVSFEFRNYIRDGADLAASLLAGCNGPGAFFPLTDQIFAAQAEWLGRVSSLPREEQQRLFSLPPQQATAALAQATGLDQFVRVRGVPSAKAQACLADQASIERLANIPTAANRVFPIPGTPTFLINGRMVEASADWKTLEPRLQEALR
jgi:protein-disulfide isomerase